MQKIMSFRIKFLNNYLLVLSIRRCSNECINIFDKQSWIPKKSGLEIKFCCKRVQIFNSNEHSTHIKQESSIRMFLIYVL